MCKWLLGIFLVWLAYRLLTDEDRPEVLRNLEGENYGEESASDELCFGSGSDVCCYGRGQDFEKVWCLRPIGLCGRR